MIYKINIVVKMRARFINEENTIEINIIKDNDDLRFYIDNYKKEFHLFYKENFVSKSGFCIEESDKWFNETYVTLHKLETFEKFRGRGFAKSLLKFIYDYVKNILNIDIISLIVYKDNIKAVNLYFDCGFKVFKEYDNSYCLIKKL